VQVREERGVLVLTVRDDGRGFDTATGSAGSGLVGISDRLAAIGGTLRVDAAPAAGTTLTAVVPTGSRPARPVEQEPAGGERFGSRRDERPVG
jgi:glucose-6-phosphate-specific signal transduction histidine kinase